MACGEPRQRAHIGGRLDAERIRSERFAIAAKPRCLERVQLGRDVGPPGIDAQPERRVRIVRIEDRLVPAGPVVLDRGGEPVRMRRARGEVCIDFREYAGAFALEPPQHGVHEARRPRVAQLARRRHGLRHRRVLGYFARCELV